MVSSLSSHNQHLQFCCVLSILANIQRGEEVKIFQTVKIFFKMFNSKQIFLDLQNSDFLSDEHKIVFRNYLYECHSINKVT